MESRKQIEEEARRRGVVLTSTGQVSAAPASEPVRSTGWLANVMPHGAGLMASLKAQLDPEIYADILRNLKRGGGYVIDHSTNIAVGSPPADQYERGRVQTRDGFAVMRVRPKGG
jgi:hypothetical protein